MCPFYYSSIVKPIFTKIKSRTQSHIYERVDNLLTYRKHLHDRIILQRGEVFVNKSSSNKRWRTPKEQPKMDNPEKLAMATYGRQDKDKQNKNTTQNVLDTTMALYTNNHK